MKKLLFALTMFTMTVSCMSPEHQNTTEETTEMDSMYVDEIDSTFENTPLGY
jgi:hypothetical protein